MLFKLSRQNVLVARHTILSLHGTCIVREAKRMLAASSRRLKMLEEVDDTKVLLTILKHGASINCLHSGHTWLQLSGS